MANTYLTRTPSSTGTSKFGQFQLWVKKSATGTNQYIISWVMEVNQMVLVILSAIFNSDIYSEATGSNCFISKYLEILMVGIIVVCILQSYSSDRVKIYVNGVKLNDYC
jgi:hypothetical protein